MEQIFQKFDLLKEKVKVTTQKLEYLRKENMMLIEENVRLKEKLETKLEGGSEQAGDKNNLQVEKVKRDLDKYIVELDKCIEMINNM